MKSLLFILVFTLTQMIVLGNGHPTKPKANHQSYSGRKPERFKLCEVTQSGTMGTYFTQVTITCTSKAPTCELASLGASLCVKFQITDLYTKITTTVN